VKKIFLILCLSSSLTALNRLEFNEIMLGTPIRQVLTCFGEPYAVYKGCPGTILFEYIERIAMNGELVYENHFFLTISNDQVISKAFREEGRLPYDQIYQEDPNYPTYP